MASGENLAPRDAKVISVILRSLGIEECEPKVIIQLLEFAYKYTTDVLEDALLFAKHADRMHISTSDVKLALQTKVGRHFVPPPPRQYLSDIAAMVNSKPLSTPEGENLIKVPPSSSALLNLDYEVLRKDSDKKRRIY
ncbi:transcription initiation factor TFIID subunit TAF9 [Encephalitozoon hellem]|uniref:Transcription initiation factor TFIID subunit TAF9 n=1 Tax=Encephalitozoon hellem TaxID=27973 RepID=A0A9Q9CAI1_ENCHE|nr:transcription initiation factor TFIID subunit TAF9 [Encephalitozoon hellem ATCC 50504]AFM97747.1 transcription initiation factor TFIID subunit TAF9 [Encephalitozoon hellem ATCC 50504]KAG5858969.1 transcription initiation factor TFIID subunit TAF9 [Encephalitozoon hellem]UTX42439.1 transcription initiation factor TFIID subunit TAF9 [Encephalitozoon hellem]WEL37882.1 transcription initiation factor TFIID subunit TAF9 [Encephalitozoon hellem]|eukprot:XP_003886728.1 transcription initiation factor TFIID subunit TAF9 [Encephalitozoon hellem ATCC 50504]